MINFYIYSYVSLSCMCINRWITIYTVVCTIILLGGCRWLYYVYICPSIVLFDQLLVFKSSSPFSNSMLLYVAERYFDGICTLNREKNWVIFCSLHKTLHIYIWFSCYCRGNKIISVKCKIWWITSYGQNPIIHLYMCSASSFLVCYKNMFILFMLSDYQRKQTARGRTTVLFYVFLHVYCLRLAWLLSERKSIALTLLHYRK